MEAPASRTVCSDLVKIAERFWSEDVDEIRRMPSSALLEEFNRVYSAWQDFKLKCLSILLRNIYDHYDSVFSIALLKLVVALEDKASEEGAVGDEIKRVTSLFSDDEKNAVREFEKFKSLEPNVTPPRLLAEYIVSKHGGIYGLIKEAVNKQYVHFNKLIESWSSKQKISNTVRRGLLLKYQLRFKNIVDAIKLLIDQEVAWLKRLFSEYEDVLLSSSKARRDFESKMREVFENRVVVLLDRLKVLEEDKARILGELHELYKRIHELEAGKEVTEEELFKLRQGLQRVQAEYEHAMCRLNEWLKELESSKKELTEKERELRELAEREGNDIAMKEALEAEALRLRQLVMSYETKARELQRAREIVELELKIAEEKLGVLEESIRGVSEGVRVSGEEAVMLEQLFIGKLRSKLMELRVIKAPWGEESIGKWEEKIYYENAENTTTVPRNTRAVFTYERRGLLGLGGTRRIEVRGVFVSDLESFKRKGYMARKATLGDLVKVLDEMRIPGNGVLALVGMASPTGWDERAVKYFTGKGPTLVTGNVFVFLVDLLENKVYYPEHLARHHPYIEQYARLFTLETNIEEEVRVEKTIRDLCEEAVAKSPWEPVFPYRYIHERLKLVSRLAITRVVSRLVNRKVIEITKGERDYLVICRSR